MEKLMIVILNYNGKLFLEKFLPSVIAYSSPYKIVIVDNASQDDSIIFLRKKYPLIQCIQLLKNEGFCQGYNIALQQLNAEYYVLLNSDVQVTQGWITPILHLMDHDITIAACQPKILSYNNKKKFDYAGAGGGLIDFFGYPFCRGRIMHHIAYDNGQYNDVCKIFWASGACFFIRSTVFHTLQGFDKRFFTHFEEVDLCWRIQQAGWSVMYQGKSCVYHVGGGTLSRSNPKKVYFNVRNHALTLYKNTSKQAFFWKKWILLYTTCLICIAQFFISRQHMYQAVKGYIDFLKLKKYYHPPSSKIKNHLNKKYILFIYIKSSIKYFFRIFLTGY